MTEESDRKDADRGERAKALLSNALLTEAFDALEQEYIAAWRKSEARDTDGRERLFVAIHVVGRVRHHLEKMVENGKVAAATLAALKRVQT